MNGSPIFFVFLAISLNLSLGVAQDGNPSTKQELFMKSLTPNLMVADVDASLEWYQKSLGFDLVQSVPSESKPGKLQWAMISNGQASLMLQDIDNLREEYPRFKDAQPGGALVLFCPVENIGGFHARAKEQGVEILHDLHNTFYGMREFSILDPDGYVITLAEEIKD